MRWYKGPLEADGLLFSKEKGLQSHQASCHSNHKSVPALLTVFQAGKYSPARHIANKSSWNLFSGCTFLSYCVPCFTHPPLHFFSFSLHWPADLMSESTACSNQCCSASSACCSLRAWSFSTPHSQGSCGSLYDTVLSVTSRCVSGILSLIQSPPVTQVS